MIKKGLFCFALIFLSLIGTVQAQENIPFQTDFVVEYKIDNTKKTEITQKIAIKNKEADFIPSKYNLTVRNIKIFDVSVKVNSTDVEYEIKEEEDVTEISFELTDAIAGLENTNNIQIRYYTFDITSKVGNTYTVKTPPVNILDANSSYLVEIEVPNELDQLITINPQQYAKSFNENTSIYQFELDQYNNGTTLVLGDKQNIGVTQKILLKNETGFAVKEYIGVPKDLINYQFTKVNKLEPKPKNLIELGGDYIFAEYLLEPDQSLEINTQTKVSLLNSQQSILPQIEYKDIDLHEYIFETNHDQENKLEAVNLIAQNLREKLKIDNTLEKSENYPKPLDEVLIHIEEPQNLDSLEITLVFQDILSRLNLKSSVVAGQIVNEDETTAADFWNKLHLTPTSYKHFDIYSYVIGQSQTPEINDLSHIGLYEFFDYKNPVVISAVNNHLGNTETEVKFLQEKIDFEYPKILSLKRALTLQPSYEVLSQNENTSLNVYDGQGIQYVLPKTLSENQKIIVTLKNQAISLVDPSGAIYEVKVSVEKTEFYKAMTIASALVVLVLCMIFLALKYLPKSQKTKVLPQDLPPQVQDQ